MPIEQRKTKYQRYVDLEMEMKKHLVDVKKAGLKFVLEDMERFIRELGKINNMRKHED